MEKEHIAGKRKQMYESDRIAILMATFNGEQYLEAQIDSLLAQSCTDWELFIHDDGSKDGTAGILKAYEQANPNRIHVLSGESCGSAKENFFFLLSLVRAPYIMFCDQDDVWIPDKIEITLAHMHLLEEQAGTRTPCLVFSDLSVTDSNLNLLAERMSVYQKLDPHRTEPGNLIIQNVITGCTVMINSALVELVLKPENTDRMIMHDWWCALLAACFGKVSFVDQPLVLYRQHEGNSVGAKKLNSWSYLKEKIQSGSEIKASLRSTRMQSALAAENYDVPPFFRDYGMLGEKRKVQRLWFYMKHHIRFCGWQRNLGLLIWG